MSLNELYQTTLFQISLKNIVIMQDEGLQGPPLNNSSYNGILGYRKHWFSSNRRCTASDKFPESRDKSIPGHHATESRH